MKTNKIVELIKSGNTAVPNYWFKEYKNLGITEEELVFLIGIQNKGVRFKNDALELSKFFNMEPTKILMIISSLEDKKLIKNDIEKNSSKKLTEYIDLSPFYEKMGMTIIETKEEKKESNLFSRFEKEFGRPLSPMEYEIINKWLEDDLSEEVVLEALKEAVYNGVHSLRYIDKIVYEWKKKGIKSSADIKKGYKKAKEDNLEKTQIFDYNWLEDAEDK